jgi:hypothetical protein
VATDARRRVLERLALSSYLSALRSSSMHEPLIAVTG